jgi:mono/diheme cytochrome c family protein
VKNFFLGFLTGIVFLFLIAAGYAASGFADVGADAPIPAWASRLLHSAIHASVRRSAPKQNNPLASIDDTLIAGGNLYLNDCVGCHGEPGKPPSDFGATFYPPAPQFPSAGTAYEEGQIFWIAKHGIRRTGMSAQEFSYTDKDLWAVTAFIHRFPNLPPDLLTKIRQQSSSNAELPK